MEEMHKARYGKRAQSFQPLPSTLLSPNLDMFNNLDALQTLSFWVFMGYYIASLVKSLATDDRTQNPVPPPS